jgi:hypothetical protein
MLMLHSCIYSLMRLARECVRYVWSAAGTQLGQYHAGGPTRGAGEDTAICYTDT